MDYCVSRLPSDKLENGTYRSTDIGGLDAVKLRKALADITGRTAIEERFGRIGIWLVGITVVSITWAVNAEYRAIAITKEIRSIEVKTRALIERHENEDRN